MVPFGLHERTANIGLPLGADLLLISFYYVRLFSLPLSVIHFFYYTLLAVYLMKNKAQKNNSRGVKQLSVDVVAGREQRAGEKELSEGGKNEERKMDNQLNHSCWLLVSKAEPLWLLPCAMTFKSARFLSEINDLPVFCHRISLLGVCALQPSSSRGALFEVRCRIYCSRRDSKGMREGKNAHTRND